jgi:hypothetical protein
MNIHSPKSQPIPERNDAKTALDVLRQWANTATDAEIRDLDPNLGRLLAPSEPMDQTALSRESNMSGYRTSACPFIIKRATIRRWSLRHP